MSFENSVFALTSLLPVHDREQRSRNPNEQTHKACGAVQTTFLLQARLRATECLTKLLERTNELKLADDQMEE